MASISPITALINRLIPGIRYPWLFAILAGLLAIDLVVPDPVPFLDEVVLAVLLRIVDRYARKGCLAHRAIVVGPTPLYGIYLDTPDVHTGLGMLGAALVAKGETVIDNAQALHSNFDGVAEKLQKLGAKINIQQFIFTDYLLMRL